MSDARFLWLDALPDMRIKGVPGVPGVQRQKSATSGSTPSPEAGCAGVPMHTQEHHSVTTGVPAKPAEICGSTPGTLTTPACDGEWGLSAELARAIQRLDLRPGSRAITAKHLWPGVVVDTVLFAKHGWAAKALALGWTERELFALSPTGRWQGLTCLLDGLQVVALDADAVTVRDCHRHQRLRRTAPTPDAVMIWELGL